MVIGNWFKKDWFKEGNDWFDKKDFAKAFECYEKWLDTSYVLDETASEIILANCNSALRANPNDAQAWRFKGIAYSEIENHLEAIKCYDKEIELKPNSERAYNNKGISLDDLGKYEEAIKCYDKAIELKKDFAAAHNNKGVTLNNLDRNGEAIECFKKAISIDSNFSSAHYCLGLSYCSMDELEKGIVHLEKAIKLGCNDRDGAENCLKEARNVLIEKETAMRKGIKKWLINNTSMSNNPVLADRFVSNMRKTNSKCHWDDKHKNIYVASINSVHAISGDNESYYLCLDCYPHRFWTE